MLKSSLSHRNENKHIEKRKADVFNDSLGLPEKQGELLVVSDPVKHEYIKKTLPDILYFGLNELVLTL